MGEAEIKQEEEDNKEEEVPPPKEEEESEETKQGEEPAAPAATTPSGSTPAASSEKPEQKEEPTPAPAAENPPPAPPTDVNDANDANGATTTRKEDDEHANDNGKDDDSVAKEHAKIDDPVEPPARNAPKQHRDSIGGTSSAGGDASSARVFAAQLPVDSTSILSRLFDPDRKQKPALWTHIQLVAPGPADQPPPGHIKWRSKDAIAAYCLKCKKQFTYTRGTSKTISRHMQAYHGLKLEGTISGSITTPTDKTAGGKGSPDDTLASPPPLKKRKPNNDSRQDHQSLLSAPVLLLKWLVGSFRPISLVQDTGLAELCACLAGSSMSTSTTTSVGLPTTAEDLIRLAMDTVEKVKLQVRHQLKDCDDYSMSCEEFETSRNGKRYTSVRITFCTPTFDRATCSLAVIPGSCNQATVHKILDDYALGLDKVTSVTLKNVPESVHLGIGGEEPCVLHKMDTLVLQLVLEEKGPVGDLVTRLWEHVQETHGWIRAGTVVAKVHQSIGSNTSKRIKDVFLMLQTYNDAPPAVLEEESTPWTPDATQKLMIQILTAILKPFYDATATLSGEKYPTLGLTIPVFRRIRDVLEKLDVNEYGSGDGNGNGISNRNGDGGDGDGNDGDDVGTTSKDINKEAVKTMEDFCKQLLESFTTSFSSLLDEDPPAMWTIPLDPRLVHMGGLSDKEKESVTKMLVHKVKERKLVGKHGDDKTNAMDTSEDGNSNDKKGQKRETSTMGGIFWGDDAEDGEAASGSASNTEAAATYARASVDRYFTTVRSHRRVDDPLDWWNRNQNHFPELSQLARIWLGASAIGPETDGRKDYPEDNVELVSFLHDNIDLII